MSRGLRAGLVLLGVLALADVATVLTTDGEFPPMEIAVLGTALGVASLALLVPAWRGRRAALACLVVLRVVAAVSAVPGVLLDGVPSAVRLLAGTAVVLTVVGCALVLPGLRRQPVQP